MSVRFDLQRFAVIAHSGNNAVVGGYVSDDSITTSGNNVTVYAGGGNDYVYNNSGNNVRMYGEDGKDSLHNYMGNGLVADAGAGDDYFNSYKAGNVSVNGGAGNDTIAVTGDSEHSITAGTGNDKLTFKDAANLGTMTINGKSITINPDTVTPQDVIKTFMKSLDESKSSNVTTMLDNAIKAAANGKKNQRQKYHHDSTGD